VAARLITICPHIDMGAYFYQYVKSYFALNFKVCQDIISLGKIFPNICAEEVLL